MLHRLGISQTVRLVKSLHKCKNTCLKYKSSTKRPLHRTLGCPQNSNASSAQRPEQRIKRQHIQQRAIGVTSGMFIQTSSHHSWISERRPRYVLKSRNKSVSVSQLSAIQNGAGVWHSFLVQMSTLTLRMPRKRTTPPDGIVSTPDDLRV